MLRLSADNQVDGLNLLHSAIQTYHGPYHAKSGALRLTSKRLKGNYTTLFNKIMLESMSIQIFPTYCFCCTILLIIKIN